MNILAVDDDRTSLIITQRALQRLGHECHIATDGIGAWSAYVEHSPDVIISDWTMPGLSGLQLCRNVRSDESGHYAYFILVTSHGHPSDVLDGMSAGADDYLIKPMRFDDLRARLIAAARVTDRHRHLDQQRAALEGLNGKLSAAALQDPLTGLGNRRALDVDLKALQARVLRYGHTYCLGLIDVDKFKSFNDTYGHQAGDRALQAVASQLKDQARGGDAVYRYGGDELLCLFPEQSIATSSIAVERMRNGVEHLGIPHAANSLGVLTFSAGLARMDPLKCRPVSQVLREADAALYQAKTQGRNSIGYISSDGISHLFGTTQLA